MTSTRPGNIYVRQIPGHVRLLTSLLGAAAAIALLPVAAQAQQSAARPTGIGTEQVIVTAEKRAEAIERVPLALSVVTGDDLKTAGVTGLNDLQNVVPALNVSRGVFGLQTTIRGVTTTDNTNKGEQGISFNVDGVNIARGIEQGVAFYDISRVEVLRGPQGTLYGKSSTGGAINIITNKPTDRFEVGAKFELGNYNTYRTEGFINIPVEDWLAVRVAGAINRRDGYIQPADGSKALVDEDNAAGRITALADLGTGITGRITVSGGHIGGVGNGQATFANFIGSDDTERRLQVGSNPFRPDANDNFIYLDGELNADLGPVTVTYLGALHDFRVHQITSSNADPAANPNRLGVAQYSWTDTRESYKTDSHELRVTNSTPSWLDYVAGANYFLENDHEDFHPWNAPVTNPTLAGSVNSIDPVNHTTHTSWGIFGQATWHITDQLGLVGGLRYSNDEVNRVGTFAPGPGPWLNPEGGPCVAPQICVGFPNNGHQSASKLTYRGGVNFQWTEDQLFYASIATGYKAGGFNDFDPFAGGTTPVPYAPEKLTAYEVGYKGNLLPNLHLNSSGFYYDYGATQLSGLVIINGGAVIFTRLAPTQIEGWENQLIWQIEPQTQFTLEANYESSKYVHFNAGVAANIPWDNLSLDNTPHFAGSVSLTHSWNLANEAALSVRIFSKYSSSYFASNFASAFRYRQDAFTRTDVSLTYDAPGGHWYAQGFVQNIENDLQALGGPTFATIPTNEGATIGVTNPRFYGVRLGLRY